MKQRDGIEVATQYARLTCQMGGHDDAVRPDPLLQGFCPSHPLHPVTEAWPADRAWVSVYTI